MATKGPCPLDPLPGSRPPLLRPTPHDFARLSPGAGGARSSRAACAQRASAVAPGQATEGPRDKGSERPGRTEADVVVSVVVVVVVANAGADVPWIVVPGTAAQDPTNGRRPGPASVRPNRVCNAGSNQPPAKIAWRRRHVCACSACAIQDWIRASMSCRPTLPARQRSRRPRSLFRKRRMFASGSRRRSGQMS